MSPMTRPAESAGVAAAIAVLLAHIFGVSDSSTITALAIVVGFVPAAITFIVSLRRPHKTRKTHLHRPPK